MNAPTVIPTRYKGYHFRSRLEARWAVFFDTMEIKWLYEPEGFSRDCGLDKPVRYLPDFYLPESCAWAEVKGNMTQEEAEKLELMLDYGSPLWHVADSDMEECMLGTWGKKARAAGADDTKFCPGIILLGEIPEPAEDQAFTLHPLITHWKGLHRRAVCFGRSRPVYVPPYLEHYSEPAPLSMREAPEGSQLKLFYSTSTSTLAAKHMFGYKPFGQASANAGYRAARSARFEYGQAGAT